MRPKVDTQPDVVIAELAAEQWGVLSLHELLRCGVSAVGIKRRVQSGRLHRIHRGVYAVGHPNIPLEGRFLAATKACGPAAVLSHYSAAVLWGVVTWQERFPEVTVPGGARCHPKLRVHRSTTLRREDVTRRHGISVTTPARTILDLAATLPCKGLRRATGQAMALNLLSQRHLLALLRRPGPRRGLANLTKIVAAGPAPTRSELEDAVLALILEHGLQPPDVNTPLRIDGRRVVPDFRWPGRRLVVEADGAKWHDNPIARQDDAERQAILEAHGERVVRVTWEQVIRRPRQTIARLVTAGAPKLQGP